MLRIIPGIMLNCRPPILAGQAAPDLEGSQGHARAGKRSAVRGHGRLSEAGPATGPAQAATKGNQANKATEPVAKHPAALWIGTAQPARSRKPLAPLFGA